MTTTFQKNHSLNLAFGNHYGDITKPDFERMRSQAKLVLEELRELLEAVYFDKKVTLNLELKDIEGSQVVDMQSVLKSIMDAQGDITTVNDGVAHMLGVSGDEILQRVYASNLTKFIKTEDQIAPALQYYYDKGFVEGQLVVEGAFPTACIKVVDTVVVADKEYPKGKFLKNMATFKEPNFDDLLTAQPVHQTIEIVVTMTTPDGQVTFGNNASVALVGPGFIEMLTNTAFAGQYMPITKDDSVESFGQVFIINEANLPEIPALWGTWKSNSRHYTVSPIASSITGLLRVD